MAARIERLRTRSERFNRQEAEQARQAVLRLEGAPATAVSQVIAAIDRNTAAGEGWTFVMISAGQHGQVVEWLAANSKRPLMAVRLWALVFQHLRRDTGEIALSRHEMAEHLGCAPQHVSNLITELEGIGAIQRRPIARQIGRAWRSPRKLFSKPPCWYASCRWGKRKGSSCCTYTEISRQQFHRLMRAEFFLVITTRQTSNLWIIS
jgi:hypothetical protein